MRTMLAMPLAVLVAAGCKSQKVLEVETEIGAAKARVAALEKKRQELTAEMKRLQVERKTFGQQADEAALAKERLSAAAFVLEKQPIPDGIQLDEALRAKSPALGKLAATIVQRQLPCPDPEEEEDSDADGPNDCSPPPLIDACEGVEQTTLQSFYWTCQRLPANGKVPATALCLAKAELDVNEYPLIAPTSHVEVDVVRMAYERDGRLVVADWPPPSKSLYEPENWSELAACEAENANAQCVRTCDERFNKLGGCGDWGDDGYEGEGEGEDDEPYELRAAREAAERAEREAEEARAELAYQECLHQCGPGDDEGEEEPIAQVGLEYKSSPAPGLYQFKVLDPEGEDKSTPPHTLLISFAALHDDLGGNTSPQPGGEGDTVTELTTVLDVQKIIEGKVSDGQRVLAGVSPNDYPVAVRISMSGKTAPVELDLDQTCAFADEVKHAQLQERCVVAKAQRDEQKAKAAAAAALKAAQRDGGVDGGTDAGAVAGTGGPAGGSDGGADAGAVAAATPSAATDAGVKP